MSHADETGKVIEAIVLNLDDTKLCPREQISAGGVGNGFLAGADATSLIEQLKRRLWDKSLSIRERLVAIQQLDKLARTDRKAATSKAREALWTVSRYGGRLIRAAASQANDERIVPNPFVWRVLVSELQHPDRRIQLRTAQILGETAAFDEDARFYLLRIGPNAVREGDRIPGYYNAICALRKRVASDPAARSAMLHLLMHTCKSARAKSERRLAAIALYDAAKDHEETWAPLVSVLLNADQAAAWVAAESLSNAVSTSEYLKKALREAQKSHPSDRRRELITWALEEPSRLELEHDEPGEFKVNGSSVSEPFPIAAVSLVRAGQKRRKRRPAENEKALIALLELLLEWPEDTISQRRIVNCKRLQEHRKKWGLSSQVRVGAINYHLGALARLCGQSGLFELDSKKQFSRFRPGIKHKLESVVQPQLIDRIRRAESQS